MRILIADDNSDDIALLEEGFRGASDREISFTRSFDGYQALESWSGQPPGYFSYVVLDFYLPKRNAIEILEAIRPIREPLEPAVVLTSHLIPADRDRLTGLGARLVLEKAATLDGLYDLARQILSL